MADNKYDFLVSIVLYNNNFSQVKECIESILDCELSYLIYLIDNSPTNHLRSLILDNNKIKYIHNPNNPGFGAAHNMAIKINIENKYSKYHLVLNPDIYFGKSVLEELYNFMEKDHEVSNVMPKVLYPNGKIQYLCKLLPTPYDWIGRRFNPFKNILEKRNNLFELRFTKYNKIMEIPYLSGCFMFLRISAIKRVGLFDENIFMYGEETDLCRRLIDGGYKTIFYPHVHIFHHFEKGSHKSWKLTKIGVQSAIYYFNKWGWFFDKRRDEINRETLNKLS